MAIISCVKCNQMYTDSLEKCPHCGYTPIMKHCPECKGLCGMADTTCINCGFSLVDVPLIPAQEDVVESTFATYVEDMKNATTRNQWNLLYKKFVSFGEFQDAQGNATVCAQHISYIELIGTLEQITSASGWRDARNQFRDYGDFLEAEAYLNTCTTNLNEALYKEAEAITPDSQANLEKLCEIYGEIGCYLDAEEMLVKYTALRDENREKQKRSMRKKLVIVGAGVLLVVALVFTFTWLIPYLRYNAAENAFAVEDYAQAEANYLAAGQFRDAVDMSVLSNKAKHYQSGEMAFEAEDFTLAHDEYISAKDYQDAAEMAKTATLANYYALGNTLLEAQKYEEAIQAFEDAKSYKESPNKIKECHYLTALCYIAPSDNAEEQPDYLSAIDEFTLAGDYLDAGEKVKQSYYDLAVTCLEAKEYLQAAEYFGMILDYNDAQAQIMNIGELLLSAKEYVTSARVFKCADTPEGDHRASYANGIVSFKNKDYKKAVTLFASASSTANDQDSWLQASKAEVAIAEGDLKAASTHYANVPQGFTTEFLDISARRQQVSNDSKFVNICGAHFATKNYIQSKNVYKRSGSWDNWYIDEPMKYQMLDIKCYLNSDNTVTIEGKAIFYRFTDYSSLNAYCNATLTEKNFKIKNVTSIPSSFKIDNDTTLKYANGKFTISYYVRDDYSASFYNIYSSEVTFD